MLMKTRQEYSKSKSKTATSKCELHPVLKVVMDMTLHLSS